MRTHDTRLFWLLASLAALLAVGVAVVDWLERISPLPLALVPAAVLLALLFWFVDDSDKPYFYPMRDFPRFAVSLVLSSGSGALAVLLLVRLCTGVPASSTPQETAHILQAVLCGLLFFIGLCAALLQLHWTRKEYSNAVTGSFHQTGPPPLPPTSY